jgi:hypothetical protein
MKLMGVIPRRTGMRMMAIAEMNNLDLPGTAKPLTLNVALSQSKFCARIS